LAKLSTISGKAHITVSENGKEVTLDVDGHWQGLNQYRGDFDVQEGGNNFKAVVVINKDKGWVKKDNTEDAPEGGVPFVQNIFYAARMPQILPLLKDNAYTLSPLGEVKVGNQDAVGLSISHKEFKDVRLFFEKKSGLPIKSEVIVPEPRTGNEKTVECHYSDYKDFDGVKLCSKINFKIGDTLEFKMEISELKAANKIDDSQFERP